VDTQVLMTIKSYSLSKEDDGQVMVLNRLRVCLQPHWREAQVLLGG
jgi:hypothetical protein